MHYYRNNVESGQPGERRHLEASIGRALNWREIYLAGPSIDNLLAGGLLPLFTGGGLEDQERGKFSPDGSAEFSLVSPDTNDSSDRIGLRMSRSEPGTDETIFWINPATHLIIQAVWKSERTSIVWDVDIRAHNQPLDEDTFTFDTAGSKGVATERELSGRAPPAFGGNGCSILPASGSRRQPV